MTMSGGYNPRSSGLLTGGGMRRSRPRKRAIKGWGKHFPDKMLSDLVAIREGVPDFVPELEFEYTPRELTLLAEKVLLEDPKDPHDAPAILNTPMYLTRIRREVYTAVGTPDPGIAEGLYWRTHPDGRKWRSPDEMAAQGSSFYH